MSKNRHTPVIVGVGDVVNRSTKVEDAVEPLTLMLQAIEKALEDTKVASSQLKQAVDSVDVVQSWTWPYIDLPGLIADKLDVKPKYKTYSPLGGNQPGRLFDEAARRISLGHSKVAILTGGEALASLSACAQAGKLPPPGWTKVDQSIESVFSPTTRELEKSLGGLHSIGAPIQVYPLYENGFRAHRGQTVKSNDAESGDLYAEFAQVASQNPIAWSYGKEAATSDAIFKVTKKNRMICFPYPLLMNALNTVNLAAAVIITSVEFADQIGISKDKRIYPLGGAGTSESSEFWKRPDYHSNPAISQSIDAALRASQISKENIELYDFYSCFPIVPKFACSHLGLPITGGSKPTTILGGLTSFGGAGNNYSMHAITEMTRRLRRRGQEKTGLILANGGVLTYQHAIVLSSNARKDGSYYPDKAPLPPMIEYGSDVPEIDEVAEGEAVIETYTVDYTRANEPGLGHIIGRLTGTNHRFIANHGDTATLKQLASRDVEPIGRKGYVRSTEITEGKNKGKRRNVFVFASVGGKERAHL